MGAEESLGVAALVVGEHRPRLTGALAPGLTELPAGSRSALSATLALHTAAVEWCDRVADELRHADPAEPAGASLRDIL